MQTRRDYYEVLGVDLSADDDTIQKAFRKIALKFHPDRNPGDAVAEEKFKEAAEAYQVLSDAGRRAQYDRFGHGQVYDPFGGFTGRSVSDIFSEIFGDVLGGERRSPTGRQRGNDLQYRLALTFEQAAFGAEVNIRLPRAKACAECAGTGSANKKRTKCETCRGAGEVRFTQGFFSVARTCTRCGGSGTVVALPCRVCAGSGRVEATSDLSVKIPAGVESGTRVRIQGEGEGGAAGGGPGDLYVLLQVEEHPIFHREDADIICEVPISFTQAALGANIEIPTLEGLEKFKIPEGTQTGKVFHLKGRGIVHLQARKRGDLHVRVVVETPQNLDQAQRELLERFADVSGEAAHPRSATFLEKVRELFRRVP